MILFSFFAFGNSLLSSERANSPPQLTAYRTGREIELDGLLAEPAWLTDQKATDFRQFQPQEGELSTERTEVRVLYNEDDLYIGVMCYDSDPKKIVAQKMERDSGLDDDDMFAMVIDTYHDHRNAYLFATNPNGAEEDGQIIDNARKTNLDWDGVWQVKSKILDQGWSAEFKIPLWNLRFASLPTQSWGINFTRIIKRKNEQANWASWTRDGGGFFRISMAGNLLDLNGLQRKLRWEVKPSILGKRNRSSMLDASSINTDSLSGGLDIKRGLSSNLTLDLTLNTDFAQVEADLEQINLTRFPLFFPEKRDFFLESASIFQFGQISQSGPPPFLLFFSRRIGIEGYHTEVPILGGGRVTGKAGKYSVGLLDILSEEEKGFPQSHFSIIRVSRDLFQRSKVGLMFTNRADAGKSINQAYGVDGNFWLSDILEVQSFFVQTYDNADSKKGQAWKIGLDFTKDHWGWVANHLAIDPYCDPGVGFVLRKDIHYTRLHFRVSPQPNNQILRRTDIRQNLNYITNSAGRLKDWDYALTFQNELSSGDRLDLEYKRIFERLDSVFHFRPNIQIPIGDYYNNQFSGIFQGSSKRQYRVTATIMWRQFYLGQLLNWGGGIGFIPNRHMSFELNYDRNKIDLPQGRLAVDLFRFRLNLALNVHLFFNSLIQYNGETHELNGNLRLNFIHTPGSDLFIVLNESRGGEGETFWNGFPARERELIVKLTYLFRF